MITTSPRTAPRDWDRSSTKRVCEACFDGDIAAIKRHAEKYLSDGPNSVPELGLRFREIVHKQNRHNWWTRALKAIEAYISEHRPTPSPVAMDSVSEEIKRRNTTEIRRLERTHNSSYLEKLFEHLFLSELLKYAYRSRGCRVEVLHPEVDDGGYDIVLICDTVTRHVQIKSSSIEGHVAFHKVHERLGERPSACVIWVLIDEDLNLTYRFFGGNPGQLINLTAFRQARHSKPNANGEKTIRPHLRVIPKSSFTNATGIDGLFKRLFGRIGSRTN